MHRDRTASRSDGRTVRSALPSGRTLLVTACALLLVSSAFSGAALAAQNLHAGSVSPGSVDEGEKVKHTFSYQVTNVSNDGNTDGIYLEFPNSVNASQNALSSFSADVTNTETGESVSISSSPSIVDGPDNDGVKETVRIGVQPSGQPDSVDLSVSFSGYATWPEVDSDTTFSIDGAVIDSKYATAGPSQVTSVTVQDTDTTPRASMNVAIDSVDDPVTAGETMTTTATVSNDGNASGTQTISLAVDGSQVDSQSVTLDAGESTSVSLSWATEAGDAGDHTLTVASENDSASTSVTVQEQADDRASFGVSIDSVESPVTAGETMTTTATVTNDGNASGTQTISLAADGSQVDSQSVTLDAGASTSVSLSWATEAGDAGDHTLTVASENDSASTSVTVQEQAADRASFSVSIDSVESPVTEGQTVTTTATVSNNGDASGTQTVSLSVDGSQVDSSTVTLDAGESTSVSLSWATASGDAGDHTLTVTSANDSDSSTVSVEEPASFEVTLDSVESPVTEGETATVNATVRNDGGVSDSERIALAVGGSRVDVTTISLSAGETKQVSLSWATNDSDAGNYTATVEAGTGTASGTLVVEADRTFTTRVLSGSVDPARVMEEQATDQSFAYQVTNVSNDGSTDALFLEFPNTVNASENALSSFSGNVTDAQTGASVSISSSPSIVDGPDGDGVKETVRIAIQPEGERTVIDVNVSFTGDVTWPAVDSDTDRSVEGAVSDSRFSGGDSMDVASVTVQNATPDESTPTPGDSTPTPDDSTPDETTDSTPDGETSTETTTAGDTGPGFGIAVVLAALGALIVAARLRET